MNTSAKSPKVVLVPDQRPAHTAGVVRRFNLARVTTSEVRTPIE